MTSSINSNHSISVITSNSNIRFTNSKSFETLLSETNCKNPEKVSKDSKTLVKSESIMMENPNKPILRNLLY